ncbi:PD-(D/E)XK nuclease family protein [Nitrolancea hollandica]|uniref:PD-(D/E)XK endonuclease-like domain-containing protein n=1 Tax=Nitrolancea hollandica Lb TaxID=1129897 RepID=I4EFM0_9BACT|nr:PD-(D/E)XK nuclease family protein [Nitrolancea hollandica]CCF83482.1 hypothetical protein NITHO_2310025 [Nitrolancea hollandica Lb]
MARTHEGGLTLSPSSALFCQRQKILKRTVDYVLDPEKEYKALGGTAYHKVLETGDQNSELFLQMPFVYPDETTVWMRCRIDHYDETWERVTDYKTLDEFMSYDPVTKKRTRTKLPREKDEIQVQLYVLVLRYNGRPVSRAQIAYLKRGGDPARQTVPVPIWDEEEIYLTAYELGKPMAEYLRSGTLPPAFAKDSPEYKRQCTYCPVFDACRELAANGE